MDYKEQINTCFELQKNICARAEEIVKLAKQYAPNGFSTRHTYLNRGYLQGDFYHYTYFEKAKYPTNEYKLRFYLNGYRPTLIGMYEDLINLDWFDKSDDELIDIFISLEKEYDVQQKVREEKEKEERRQEYLKLREEFEENENE